MVLTKTFEFNNHPQEITGFTRHFLDELTTILAPYHHESSLLFKVKTIVTELLNNAVKHSGTQHTLFEVSLDSSTLTVVKKDSGQPFRLINGPLEKNAEVVISKDAMHLLYAVKQSENSLHFFCEEIPICEGDVNQLTEHMGLLIITKAADEFTYQHQNAVNLFSVKLQLS